MSEKFQLIHAEKAHYSIGLMTGLFGRSSELVRVVHPVGTQFRRPGTVARFRVF